LSPARARIGYAVAAAIVLLGVTYPLFGDSVVRSLVPDTSGCPGARDVPAPANEASTKRATLCLLNRRRAEHGLRPLASSRVLARAARAHSRDMASRRYFAHDAPDGRTPARRIAAAGYPREGVTVGENLAWGEDSAAAPAEIVAGWMESPGHRANVLRREYTEIGIGLAHDAPRPVTGRAAIYTTSFGHPPAVRTAR
jgi:uncharacterized protein YkwD